MVDFLKIRVEQWFKEHKTHKGKWTLIGRIAKDLKLETFPYQFAGRGKHYDWNNDVAKALNELRKQNKIETVKDGRAYRISWSEKKDE